jgi:hypothetical protein
MYAGANGSKICVMVDNKPYMLKFPSNAKLNKDMSYSNSCFSEYLGCQIYKSVGIPVQKTILGTYVVKGEKQSAYLTSDQKSAEAQSAHFTSDQKPSKTDKIIEKERVRIVVACEDFTEPGIILQDFASLKNQMIDSEHNGYGTELSDIMLTIEEQTAVDQVALKERFWDMFIVDALIGNWDRHNGNWGFLYDTRTDQVTLAPVYDCGSCLYPQADESIMESVLNNDKELQFRIYEIPTSALKINGKKIKYFEFISSLQNEDCNRALMRIAPRIDMGRIRKIVENTPFISELQKRFYMTMLEERKRVIIDGALLVFSGRR